MVVFLLAALLGMVLFTKPEVIGQTAVVMYQYSMTVTAVDRFSLILSQGNLSIHAARQRYG